MAGLLEQLARVSDGDRSDGRPLQLPYSRRELAEMIGVSTETAIRLFARLKRKGAVTVDGRDLVIADAERLHRVAQYHETTP